MEKPALNRAAHKHLQLKTTSELQVKQTQTDNNSTASNHNKHECMHVEKAYFKNKEDGVQLLPLRFVP